MISNEVRISIKEYLNTRSNEASNRLVKNPELPNNIEDNRISARYLDDNQISLYKEWTPNFEEQKPCLSTFRKYLTKEAIFKKPYRWTDLCEYCETIRHLKIKLPNDLAELGYQWPNNLSYSEENLLQHFKNIDEAKKFLLLKKNDEGINYEMVILF